MIFFFDTSKNEEGKSKHKHVGFIDAQTGSGFLLEANKHRHPVVYHPEEQVIVVEPDPEDGHTHQFVEYKLKDIKVDETETEILSDVKENFQQWYRYSEECFDRGNAAYNYYVGEQWSDAQEKYMTDAGKPKVTVNEIQSNIDYLCGFFQENRTDYMGLARHDVNPNQGEIATDLLKFLSDDSDLPYEEDAAFRDMVITGTCGLDVFLDKQENMFGDIKVMQHAWDGVVMSECQRQDISDCEGIVKYRYVSEKKLKQIAPKKAKDVSPDSSGNVMTPVEETITNPGHDFNFTNSRVRLNKRKEVIAGLTYYDPSAKQYLLLERWLVTYPEIVFITDPDGRRVFSTEGWRKGDVATIESEIRKSGQQIGHPLKGYKAITRRPPRMRVTICAGDVVLRDDYPANLPVHKFHWVPAFAYFVSGKFFGKVEAAKELQDIINKRTSQAIDIVNRFASYIWFFERGAFADDNEEANFRAHSSKPGTQYALSDMSLRPQREEGTRFPSEVSTLEEKASAKLDKVMNILPEQDIDFSSADSYLLRRETKMTGNNHLFVNFNRAKVQVGKLMLAMAQKNYSVERLDRILNGRPPIEPDVDPETQEPIPWEPKYSRADLEAFKNNTDLNKVDVVTVLSESAPTAQMGMFATITSLQQRGVAIDPQLAVQYAPVPASAKESAQQNMAAAAEAEAETAQTTNDTEIEKSLLGQGIVPPSVYERFNLQDAIFLNKAQGMQPQNPVPGEMPPPTDTDLGSIDSEGPPPPMNGQPIR